jgi:hypothetical protein
VARNFTIQWEPPEVSLPSSAYAEFDAQNQRPVNAFDPATDESAVLEGTLPAEYTGAGTLKLRMLAMANTSTSSHKARIDVVTEFRTPQANESGNLDAFDASPDSGTFAFGTSAYTVQSLVIALTPSTVPAAGDRFRIKVTRDADHATDDDLPVDLLVLGYELYEET